MTAHTYLEFYANNNDPEVLLDGVEVDPSHGILYCKCIFFFICMGIDAALLHSTMPWCRRRLGRLQNDGESCGGRFRMVRASYVGARRLCRRNKIGIVVLRRSDVAVAFDERQRDSPS